MMRLVLLMCLLAGAASAQSYSASDWTILRHGVVVRVSLPAPAIDLIGGVPGGVAQYVLAHVDVHAGDAPCPAIDQGEGIGQIDTLAPIPGRARFELVFACQAGGALRLDNHILFERDPGHLDFARLRVEDRPGAISLLFDAAHQRVRVPADGLPPGVSLARFIPLGARAALASLVRTAILVLLLAPSGRRQDWIAVLGGVLLGAIAASALVLAGVAATSPQAAAVTVQLLALLLALRAAAARHPRAAVAVLAMVVGALLALDAARRHAGLAQVLAGAALLAPAIWVRRSRAPGIVLPAALFGLVLDAAFGDAVRQAGLPRWQSALPEMGHAIGALSAILLMAGLTAAARWGIRRTLAAPAVAVASGWACSGIALYATAMLVRTI